ncbi:MAG: non-homologous end-joining DNA ligase [Acidimicrobiales bacterium]
MPDARRVTVQVEGRQLSLSNLDKVLYPDAGFTKGEVIDYYTRVAPAMLPHVKDRPLTFKRYPEGVEGGSFFQKNVPSHAPGWVRTVAQPSEGGTVEHAVICDLPTLVWAANLATLEVHVPMWRVDGGGAALHPDLLVFDLDPGPPATIVECCRVAALIGEELGSDGLHAYPKTSGSKGLQLYVPLRPERPWEDVHAYARGLAERLGRSHPELVVSDMRKARRANRVLIDWSQNHRAKTTVAAYSLRARPFPTVSAPVTWDEVGACAGSGDPDDLRFLAGEVVERVRRDGDLFAPALDRPQPLPA